MKRGKVVSKGEFLQEGQWSKEEYEGLLVSADPDSGLYNIAVQLSDDRVLVVDQAGDDSIHRRLQDWAPQVYAIQRNHGTDLDLGNYTR